MGIHGTLLPGSKPRKTSALADSGRETDDMGLAEQPAFTRDMGTWTLSSVDCGQEILPPNS